eukprot:2227789-Amphidinium_carterae.1
MHQRDQKCRYRKQRNACPEDDLHFAAVNQHNPQVPQFRAATHETHRRSGKRVLYQHPQEESGNPLQNRMHAPLRCREHAARAHVLLGHHQFNIACHVDLIDSIEIYVIYPCIQDV